MTLKIIARQLETAARRFFCHVRDRAAAQLRENIGVHTYYVHVGLHIFISPYRQHSSIVQSYKTSKNPKSTTKIYTRSTIYLCRFREDRRRVWGRSTVPSRRRICRDSCTGRPAGERTCHNTRSRPWWCRRRTCTSPSPCSCTGTCSRRPTAARQSHNVW